MYEGIEKALGPTQSKPVPLKSAIGETIKDKGNQMERWMEHYAQLYSKESTISDAAYEAVEPLPVMDDMDETPQYSQAKQSDRRPAYWESPWARWDTP